MLLRVFTDFEFYLRDFKGKPNTTALLSGVICWLLQMGRRRKLLQVYWIPFLPIWRLLKIRLTRGVIQFCSNLNLAVTELGSPRAQWKGFSQLFDCIVMIYTLKSKLTKLVNILFSTFLGGAFVWGGCIQENLTHMD